MQQFDQAPVPDDIQAQVGTLSNLTTTDKSNLVGAVNEVKSTLTDQIGSLEDTGKCGGSTAGTYSFTFQKRGTWLGIARRDSSPSTGSGGLYIITCGSSASAVSTVIASSGISSISIDHSTKILTVTTSVSYQYMTFICVN